MQVMARPAQGQVVVRERKGGRVYALRFHAYGQRQFVTLGSSADGWTRARAEEELQNVLADVRRGLWRPPEPPPIFEPPTTVPTFLEVAVEYDLIPRNTAAGKRRRLKVDKPRPVHLDSAAQIVALLDAASALDARPTARTSGRRALIATLAFAGLRSAEAVGLQWRD